MQGDKRGWNDNDCNGMLILVNNKRSDRQLMPLLKRANVSTEEVRTQSTVGRHRVRETLRWGLPKPEEEGMRIGPNLKFAREGDDMLTHSQRSTSERPVLFFFFFFFSKHVRFLQNTVFN